MEVGWTGGPLQHRGHCPSCLPMLCSCQPSPPMSVISWAAKAADVICTNGSLKYFTEICGISFQAQFMVGINQSDFHRVNKQTAFKHLVRRDRESKRDTLGRCVVFLWDMLINRKDGRMGRTWNRKNPEKASERVILRSGFRWRLGMHSKT